MNITVIGSGVMASGIIQVLASSSHIDAVNVVSRNVEKAELLKVKVCKQIDKMAKKGKLAQDIADLSFEKIKLFEALDICKTSDLVIEAISEDLLVKLELFQKLSKFISDDTIIASNTSSLSITAFGSVLPNPKNVVGLHFFNPAPLMELVEIVMGHETSPSVVEKMGALAELLNKKPVFVNEAPGFIVNRMLIPMINEAVSILAEGVATAEDIDKAMKFGAHHPMGPLALADLIGNDVNLSIMETLYSETGDSKYRAHPLLRKMVRANHLGRKTNKGFFDY
ncbi:MAG: 3-hydroxyacyl-CoA dehydrogenase family protein [Parashewanella sp.]